MQSSTKRTHPESSSNGDDANNKKSNVSGAGVSWLPPPATNGEWDPSSWKPGQRILSNEQLKFLDDNGFLVIERFIPDALCEELKLHSQQLVDEFFNTTDLTQHKKVVFTTTDQASKMSDDYFINSGGKCLVVASAVIILAFFFSIGDIQ
jgi:hypothetical protein